MVQVSPVATAWVAIMCGNHGHGKYCHQCPLPPQRLAMAGLKLQLRLHHLMTEIGKLIFQTALVKWNSSSQTTVSPIVWKGKCELMESRLSFSHREKNYRWHIEDKLLKDVCDVYDWTIYQYTWILFFFLLQSFLTLFILRWNEDRRRRKMGNPSVINNSSFYRLIIVIMIINNFVST